MCKTTRQNKIRNILKQYPDGLNVNEIAERTNLLETNIRTAMHKMPDVYRDRWERSSRGYQGVWCVVKVPDNCPHPTDKRLGKPPKGMPKTVWQQLRALQ